MGPRELMRQLLDLPQAEAMCFELYYPGTTVRIVAQAVSVDFRPGYGGPGTVHVQLVPEVIGDVDLDEERLHKRCVVCAGSGEHRLGSEEDE